MNFLPVRELAARVMQQHVAAMAFRGRLHSGGFAAAGTTAIAAAGPPGIAAGTTAIAAAGPVAIAAAGRQPRVPAQGRGGSW
jgi:hypothetical protein